MTSYYDKRNFCREGYTAGRLIEETIFARITPETTPQQFQLAQESLRRLCERFEAQLDLFHYAAISGSHQCVRDVFEDARARLANLAIMQPQPKPPSVQQGITSEGIISNLEEQAQTSETETDVGIDDSSFDNWNGR